MKVKRKIISLLLAVCLVAGLMPTLAFAADTNKDIELVNNGTAANIIGGRQSSVYFGNYQQSSAGANQPEGIEDVDWILSDTADEKGQGPYYYKDPIKWKVLANKGDGKLFLLSDQNLDVVQYHTDGEAVTWAESTMRSWLNGYAADKNIGGDRGIDYSGSGNNFLDNAFSDSEQSAVVTTEVVNADNPSGTEGGDNIFLLSIDEVDSPDYFFDDNSRKATNTAYVNGGGKTGSGNMNDVGEADYWWLRSPGNYDLSAAYVSLNGDVINNGVHVDFGNLAVRPAFNLNLKSVLFTSAAEGGKIPAGGDGGTGVGEADSTLNAVKENTSNEWKLTLEDATRNFTASLDKAEAAPSETVKVSYEGAKTGENEYVSAMITDANGEVLYYGRIAKDSERGTADVTIPSGLAEGEYTLKLFSEQCNGDKKTDYASAFANCSLKVVSDVTPPVVTYYDITAEQPAHGEIKLSRDRIYRYGDVDITLTPEEGYEVADLLVNGNSVGAVDKYTIKDVTEDCHVTAVFKETEAHKNARLKEGVQATTIKAWSSAGKGWIKINYKKSYGFKVDGYEIFRSVKKNSGYGTKAFFKTTNKKTTGWYKNTKQLKKGTRYYYKVRGYRTIGEEKVYTKWSNKAIRTAK